MPLPVSRLDGNRHADTGKFDEAMAVTNETSGGRRALSVDVTLRWVVVGFRMLSWLWMTVLVVVAVLLQDDIVMFWVLSAMVVATAWTGLMVWARKKPFLRTMTMFWIDTAAALFIGSASTLAEADALFYGGMPISWIVSAAYVGGFRYAMPASLVVAAQQTVLQILDGRGVSAAAGSLVFPVFAIITGLLFDTSRATERARDDAMEQLSAARNEQVRHEERALLANVLHDSVLQTLNALQSDADDAEQVRYLARRQERELRRTISEYQSKYSNSMRTHIISAADYFEDTFRIAVELSIRGDAALTDDRRAVCDAVNEALVNAGKHAGVGTVDVYAELDHDRVYVFVRDRGKGFDLESGNRSGMVHSLIQRVEAVGGRLYMESEPGAGTCVSVELPAPTGA